MTETITRAHLAELLEKKVANLNGGQCLNVVDNTLEALSAEIVKVGELKVSSFGVFSVRKKAQRMGRNPKTKKPAVISARKVLTFAASKTLVNKANGKKK
jgi:integration host factor subunit alpha